MHQKVLLKGIVHRKDQNSRGNRKQEQVSANTPAQDPHIHQIIKRYRHFQNNLAVLSSSCPPNKNYTGFIFVSPKMPVKPSNS